LGVVTADCVPVLFAAIAANDDQDDNRAEAVAAAHAGWRGLAAGVLQRVVQRFEQEFGVAPSSLRVAIGPCISAPHYEVGPEVIEHFPLVPGAVCQAAGDKHLLDLARVARHQLEGAGVPSDAISTAEGACTFSQPGLFFSYRREGQATGHHLSVIGLRS
jgi:YfiH family protein